MHTTDTTISELSPAPAPMPDGVAQNTKEPVNRGPLWWSGDVERPARGEAREPKQETYGGQRKGGEEAIDRRNVDALLPARTEKRFYVKEGEVNDGCGMKEGVLSCPCSATFER